MVQLLYAVALIPAGYLADKTDRPRLLAGGLALWSVLTMAASKVVVAASPCAKLAPNSLAEAFLNDVLDGGGQPLLRQKLPGVRTGCMYCFFLAALILNEVELRQGLHGSAGDQLQ